MMCFGRRGGNHILITGEGGLVMKGFIKPLIVVAAYHLIVGAAVLSTVSTEKPLSMEHKVEFVVVWPVVVGTTNYLQAQYETTMKDIREMLDEINSGRWERKGH
jgi:hypothetical protein